MSKKPIPEFTNEAEEAAFWAETDSADYIDWSQAEPAIFSELKPTTKAISMRLPESLIFQLKAAANKQDVPYQSLIKTILFDYVTKQGNPPS